MDFLKIFRGSTLSSVAPEQVLFSANFKDGDWGLKRNLDQRNMRLIKVRHLDDRNGLTRYHSGSPAMYQPLIWKENFPIPSKAFPLPKKAINLQKTFFPNTEKPQNTTRSTYRIMKRLTERSKMLAKYETMELKEDDLPVFTDSPEYIGTLPPSKFRKTLALAKIISPIWKRLIEKKLIAKEEWFKILNLSNHQDIDLNQVNGDGNSLVHPPSYRSRELMDHYYKEDLIPEGVLLPTISSVVLGRVLNPVELGYAIGIAGFVAFCPSSNIRLDARLKVDRGTLREFDILEARFDKNGNPEIIVGAAGTGVNSRSSPSFKKPSAWNSNRGTSVNFDFSEGQEDSDNPLRIPAPDIANDRVSIAELTKLFENDFEKKD